MGFPNLKNKHSRGALFSPGDFMAYLKRVGRYPRFRPPHGMILCYQASLMDYILKKHKTTRVRGIGGGDTYLLDETGGRVGVTGRFGIGAPAAVTNLEELIAFGVKRFISVGTAGALRKGVNIGDLMVCDRAIRDEGTSYHYLKPSKYAYPSKELTDGIRAALTAGGLEFFSGTTWTVDGPVQGDRGRGQKVSKGGRVHGGDGGFGAFRRGAGQARAHCHHVHHKRFPGRPGVDPAVPPQEDHARPGGPL